MQGIIQFFVKWKSPKCLSKAKKTLKFQKGFSLLEIMIVLGIIGGIVALVATTVSGGAESAKKKETALHAANVQSGLLRYQQDMGKLPETSEGLNVLITSPGSPKWGGPYVGGGEGDLKDGWGNTFEYEKTTKGAKLTSPGSGDGVQMVFINGKLQDAVPEANGASSEQENK